jgi:hypothetical protein
MLETRKVKKSEASTMIVHYCCENEDPKSKKFLLKVDWKLFERRDDAGQILPFRERSTSMYSIYFIYTYMI